MARGIECDTVIPAWTGFNQATNESHVNQAMIGYLPIIPAPTHDLDTMMTWAISLVIDPL